MRGAYCNQKNNWRKEPLNELDYKNNHLFPGTALVNLPNILTLSRIPCLFLVVGLLYLPFEGAKTLAFFLFVVGSVTDWLDGFLARRYAMISNFGKLMDALTDKVFIVGACVAWLATRALPAWSLPLILLIITREFFVTGLRLVAASQGRVLAAEAAGKIKTVVQMISLAILIGSYAIQADFFPDTRVPLLEIAHTTGLFLFVMATGLTVYSGLGYLSRYGDLLKDRQQTG